MNAAKTEGGLLSTCHLMFILTEKFILSFFDQDFYYCFVKQLIIKHYKPDADLIITTSIFKVIECLEQYLFSHK